MFLLLHWRLKAASADCGCLSPLHYHADRAILGGERCVPCTLELSMIVKDGAATLRRCLQSAAPIADRILIGDTGSTDRTVEVAEDCGAEVIRVPWEEDFAKARNRMLAQARCDWILVLDADEMLDADGPARIRELLGRKHVDAYDVWRWNYVRATHVRSGEQPPVPNPVVIEESRRYPAYNLSLNTRLFRRHPQVCFEHSVHETVAGCIDALGLHRMQADFVIHHFGQAEDSEAVRTGKNELYYRLGLKKLEAEPENAAAWFETGLSELEYRRDAAVALPYFERAAQLNPRSARAWLFAGICLVRTGQLQAALERFSTALKLGLQSPVLFESIGDAYFHAAQYAQACAAYQHAEAAGSISSSNEAKLGACEVHLGRAEQGIRRMKQAVEKNPHFAELYDILVAGALLAGNLKLATETAQARLGIGNPQARHFQIAAELKAALVNREEPLLGQKQEAPTLP
jgi:Tfp pilus assembly protein PilF